MLRWFLFTMIFALAACGGGGDDEGSDSDDATNGGSAEADPAFILDISVTEGGNGETFTDGRFLCDETFRTNGEVPLYVIAAGDLTGVPGVGISIPRDTGTGTFDFATSSDTMDPAAIEIEYGTRPADSDSLNFTDYEENVTGQITFDSFPQAAGERLTGSLNATLESEDGETATLEGTFDLELTDFIIDNFCNPDA